MTIWNRLVTDNYPPRGGQAYTAHGTTLGGQGFSYSFVFGTKE